MKNIIKNNMKMPKTAGWLIPGLEIKKWFALIFLGCAFIILGILTLSTPEQVYNILTSIKKSVNVDLVAGLAICLGAILFFKGWQKTNLSMLFSAISHLIHLTMIISGYAKLLIHSKQLQKPL